MGEQISEGAVREGLPDWQIEPGGKAVTRAFKFEGFGDAFAFMTRVAIEADRIDHHPEWSNVYNKVEIRLTTHDAGGLTAKDVALGQVADRAGKALGAS